MTILNLWFLKKHGCLESLRLEYNPLTFKTIRVETEEMNRHVMNIEEFREAYLEAQNGLGNDIQALINLSRNLTELATRVHELAENTQANYLQMNQVVEQFIHSQERE